MIENIRKRNGELVPFNRTKIQTAMEKAAVATDPENDTRGFDILTDHVVRHVEDACLDTPGVEDIQDMVELTLMEFGHRDIAKVYMDYRDKHAAMRAQEVPLEIFPDTVFDINGMDLNRDGLRDFFVGHGVLDFNLEPGQADVLIDICLGSLYNGMTEAELNQSMMLAAASLIERDPIYSKIAAKLCLDLMIYPFTLREAFADLSWAIHQGINHGKLDPRLDEFDLAQLQAYIVLSRDNLFEYMGLQVLADRYLLREGVDGPLIECPQVFWMRVAMGLAINEGDQKNEWAIKFYDLFSQLRYVPSTPTLLHSGTTHPQLSSCFLNTVEDDLAHIFKVHGDNAQLLKYSGGVGTDWTNVRSTGSEVKSIGIASQGVVPFLKIANDTTVSINRSGKRRGAAVVYLEPWHLDIEDFIDLKRSTGDERRRAHDLSTALWIPDLFMKRVAEDGDWTLFSPHEVPELHHIYGQRFEEEYVRNEAKAKRGDFQSKTIKAAYLWRRILATLFETGHPWITFKDACNVRSPQQHVGVVHASNLCTEITLNTSAEETAVCNLGSINLAAHIADRPSEITALGMDWDLLSDTIRLAVRALDNTIDINFYPTPEAYASNLKHRPIGLGIMGLQDCLYQMDIPFDSEIAVSFNDHLMEFVSYYAINASSELAVERGCYESFEGSLWDSGILPVDTLAILERERGVPIAIPASANSHHLDWHWLRNELTNRGMRNSNVMAIAPTATIANICGVFPSIEPPFQLLYSKENMSGVFTLVNQYLVAELKKLGLWDARMVDELKQHRGSVQGIPTVPPSIKAKFKTAFEIDSEWVIKAAARRAKWLDQSQSVNLWFAKGSTGRRLSSIYFMAWHMGLKTTYYLRTGAASNIESSTLGQTVAIVATSINTDEPVVFVEDFPLEAKVCSIDDQEGCESCQ